MKISKQFSVDFIKQKNMPEGAFLSLDFEVQNLTVFVQSTSDKVKVIGKYPQVNIGNIHLEWSYQLERQRREASQGDNDYKMSLFPTSTF